MTKEKGELINKLALVLPSKLQGSFLSLADKYEDIFVSSDIIIFSCWLRACARCFWRGLWASNLRSVLWAFRCLSTFRGVKRFGGAEVVSDVITIDESCAWPSGRRFVAGFSLVSLGVSCESFAIVRHQEGFPIDIFRALAVRLGPRIGRLYHPIVLVLNHKSSGIYDFLYKK